MKIGVFACIFQEGKILLGLRRDGKGWNLLGGTIDLGQGLHEALILEVWQEGGLRICPLHIMGFCKRGDDVAIAFACKVLGGDLTLSDETVELGYFDLEDVSKLKVVSARDGSSRMLKMIEEAFRLLKEGGEQKPYFFNF